MLFIYDENCIERIRLNVDIKEQRKRLFSKYTLNFVFLNIQTLKESFNCHRIFINVESLRDRSYFSSFWFFFNESISKFDNKNS